MPHSTVVGERVVGAPPDSFARSASPSPQVGPSTAGEEAGAEKEKDGRRILPPGRARISEDTIGTLVRRFFMSRSLRALSSLMLFDSALNGQDSVEGVQSSALAHI
jgi:hypothetical protein